MQIESVFRLTNFKIHSEFRIDITNYTELHYSPEQFKSDIKKDIEPALTEDELYNHMKNISGWDFSKGKETEYYREECISLLREIDFQTLSHYGKLCSKNFSKAKNIYYFDIYLRNWLQRHLECIEIFLKKATIDGLLINYSDSVYIFSNDNVYYDETKKKYQSNNLKRRESVQKCRYKIYELIEAKRANKNIQTQLEQYGVVLPWTVIKMMTFGNLSSFLSTLNPKYRDKIAQKINLYNSGDIIKTKLLLAWVNSLRFLRNECSHNSVLYGENYSSNEIKIHENDRQFFKEINAESFELSNQKLFAWFLAIKRLYMCMSKDSQRSWNKKLMQLEYELRLLPEYDITGIGFPKEWLNYLIISDKA